MPRTLIKRQIKIGPADNGRRMSLAKFDHAIGQAGYLYELSRGVITVMDIPNLKHFVQVESTRDQFSVFKIAHPGWIYAIAGAMECKIPIARLVSERHPDLAIYLTAPPDVENPWELWIPDIVIEVVSRGSKQRDYFEKPEEYFLFGIKEYWILDLEKREMLVHQRVAGRWIKQTIRPPQVYHTPELPGFKFDCGRVFQAADVVGKSKDGRERPSPRKRS